MGPGADAPGNTDGYGIATRDELLQWGRGQMPPEMRTRPSGIAGGIRLQWGRGQMPPEIVANNMAEALAEALQWGRGQMPPEIRMGTG